MSRPLGLKKTGGRQKGTPNKDTNLLQAIFKKHDLSIPDKIAELLPSLEPQKQADVLIRLMEYLYPKRKSDQEIVVIEESLCQRCIATEENTKTMTTKELQEDLLENVRMFLNPTQVYDLAISMGFIINSSTKVYPAPEDHPIRSIKIVSQR